MRCFDLHNLIGALNPKFLGFMSLAPFMLKKRPDPNCNFYSGASLGHGKIGDSLVHGRRGCGKAISIGYSLAGTLITSSCALGKVAIGSV